MRWLVIALLISLLALLLAAAALARHIWTQRARVRSKPDAGLPPPLDPDLGPAEETEVETEI